MNEKQLESNTQNAVDESQLFEFAIMLLLLNEFEKVAKGGNQSESANNIRKELKKEITTFQKVLGVSIVDTLNKSNEVVLNDLKGADDINYYNVSKHSKNTILNAKKYIKSKGIVLGGQKIETFFYNLCKEEAESVVNGTITLEKAMQNACKKLGQNGISFITYDKVKRKIDVFVRQELLYAQKQSYQDIQFKYAEDNDITVFETDAHPNARPTHTVWQGKRWDTTGKIYPTFDQLSRGNGSYNDYGCLHIITPVIDIDSPLTYTDKELKNIDTKPFNFRGKEYTGYEAKERMRSLEREIRAYKRETALLDKKNIENKKSFESLKNKQKEYREFCKAFGTYPRNNRTRVYTDKSK